MYDTFPSRITLHTTHPSIRSDDFPTWLADKQAFISSLHDDGHTLLTFSDGSVRPASHHHSTAAFLLSHRGRVKYRRSFATGRATSFDAELAALTAALRKAIDTANTLPNISAIHMFADNESALHSLFDTSLHSSHIMSVLSAKHAREWLEAEPTHHIHLHWIPGHRGVALNERADRLAHDAHDLLEPINHISYAHARALITKRIMEDWAKIPSIGKSFFPPQLRTRSIKCHFFAHLVHLSPCKITTSEGITLTFTYGSLRIFHLRLPCSLAKSWDVIA